MRCTPVAAFTATTVSKHNALRTHRQLALRAHVPSPLAALILVPTRELALQSAHVCKELGKYLNVQVMTSTGGTFLRDDIQRLSQPVHVVVATPGRIQDLEKKNVARLNQCNILVMDEVRPTAQQQHLAHYAG